MKTWMTAALTALGAVGVTASGAAQLSPRDTTLGSIGGATILVDYGRPSKRSREIFGGLVPYGQVWRTGANKATHLVTDRPLGFGDLTVPPGTYTLYTLPGSTAWKLIINRQTEQWGTEYDAGQDLGRVDLRVESLPSAVEQFAIKIEARDRGGVLRLEWDRTAAWVPFVVR
jgi:hypothetical protein